MRIFLSKLNPIIKGLKPIEQHECEHLTPENMQIFDGLITAIAFPESHMGHIRSAEKSMQASYGRLGELHRQIQGVESDNRGQAEVRLSDIHRELQEVNESGEMRNVHQWESYHKAIISLHVPAKWREYIGIAQRKNFESLDTLRQIIEDVWGVDQGAYLFASEVMKNLIATFAPIQDPKARLERLKEMMGKVQESARRNDNLTLLILAYIQSCLKKSHDQWKDKFNSLDDLRGLLKDLSQDSKGLVECFLAGIDVLKKGLGVDSVRTALATLIQKQKSSSLVIQVAMQAVYVTLQDIVQANLSKGEVLEAFRTDLVVREQERINEFKSFEGASASQVQGVTGDGRMLFLRYFYSAEDFLLQGKRLALALQWITDAEKEIEYFDVYHQPTLKEELKAKRAELERAREDLVLEMLHSVRSSEPNRKQVQFDMTLLLCARLRAIGIHVANEEVLKRFTVTAFTESHANGFSEYIMNKAPGRHQTLLTYLGSNNAIQHTKITFSTQNGVQVPNLPPQTSAQAKDHSLKPLVEQNIQPSPIRPPRFFHIPAHDFMSESKLPGRFNELIDLIIHSLNICRSMPLERDRQTQVFEWLKAADQIIAQEQGDLGILQGSDFNAAYKAIYKFASELIKKLYRETAGVIVERLLVSFHLEKEELFSPQILRAYRTFVSKHGGPQRTGLDAQIVLSDLDRFDLYTNFLGNFIARLAFDDIEINGRAEKVEISGDKVNTKAVNFKNDKAGKGKDDAPYIVEVQGEGASKYRIVELDRLARDAGHCEKYLLDKDNVKLDEKKIDAVKVIAAIISGNRAFNQLGIKLDELKQHLKKVSSNPIKDEAVVRLKTALIATLVSLVGDKAELVLEKCLAYLLIQDIVDLNDEQVILFKAFRYDQFKVFDGKGLTAFNTLKSWILTIECEYVDSFRQAVASYDCSSESKKANPNKYEVITRLVNMHDDYKAEINKELIKVIRLVKGITDPRLVCLEAILANTKPSPNEEVLVEYRVKLLDCYYRSEPNADGKRFILTEDLANRRRLLTQFPACFQITKDNKTTNYLELLDDFIKNPLNVKDFSLLTLTRYVLASNSNEGQKRDGLSNLHFHAVCNFLTIAPVDPAQDQTGLAPRHQKDLMDRSRALISGLEGIEYQYSEKQLQELQQLITIKEVKLVKTVKAKKVQENPPANAEAEKYESVEEIKYAEEDISQAGKVVIKSKRPQIFRSGNSACIAVIQQYFPDNLQREVLFTLLICLIRNHPLLNENDDQFNFINTLLRTKALELTQATGGKLFSKAEIDEIKNAYKCRDLEAERKSKSVTALDVLYPQAHTIEIQSPGASRHNDKKDAQSNSIACFAEWQILKLLVWPLVTALENDISYDVPVYRAMCKEIPEDLIAIVVDYCLGRIRGVFSGRYSLTKVPLVRNRELRIFKVINLACFSEEQRAEVERLCVPNASRDNDNFDQLEVVTMISATRKEYAEHQIKEQQDHDLKQAETTYYQIKNDDVRTIHDLKIALGQEISSPDKAFRDAFFRYVYKKIEGRLREKEVTANEEVNEGEVSFDQLSVKQIAGLLQRATDVESTQRILNRVNFEDLTLVEICRLHLRATKLSPQVVTQYIEQLQTNALDHIELLQKVLAHILEKGKKVEVVIAMLWPSIPETKDKHEKRGDKEEFDIVKAFNLKSAADFANEHFFELNFRDRICSTVLQLDHATILLSLSPALRGRYLNVVRYFVFDAFEQKNGKDRDLDEVTKWLESRQAELQEQIQAKASKNNSDAIKTIEKLEKKKAEVSKRREENTRVLKENLKIFERNLLRAIFVIPQKDFRHEQDVGRISVLLSTEFIRQHVNPNIKDFYSEFAAHFNSILMLHPNFRTAAEFNDVFKIEEKDGKRVETKESVRKAAMYETTFNKDLWRNLTPVLNEAQKIKDAFEPLNASLRARILGLLECGGNSFGSSTDDVDIASLIQQMLDVNNWDGDLANQVHAAFDDFITGMFSKDVSGAECDFSRKKEVSQFTAAGIKGFVAKVINQPIVGDERQNRPKLVRLQKHILSSLSLALSRNISKTNFRNAVDLTLTLAFTAKGLFFADCEGAIPAKIIANAIMKMTRNLTPAESKEIAIAMNEAQQAVIDRNKKEELDWVIDYLEQLTAALDVLRKDTEKTTKLHADNLGKEASQSRGHRKTFIEAATQVLSNARRIGEKITVDERVGITTTDRAPKNIPSRGEAILGSLLEQPEILSRPYLKSFLLIPEVMTRFVAFHSRPGTMYPSDFSRLDVELMGIVNFNEQLVRKALSRYLFNGDERALFANEGPSFIIKQRAESVNIQGWTAERIDENNVRYRLNVTSFTKTSASDKNSDPLITLFKNLIDESKANIQTVVKTVSKVKVQECGETRYEFFVEQLKLKGRSNLLFILQVAEVRQLLIQHLSDQINQEQNIEFISQQLLTIDGSDKKQIIRRLAFLLLNNEDAFNSVNNLEASLQGQGAQCLIGECRFFNFIGRINDPHSRREYLLKILTIPGVKEFLIKTWNDPRVVIPELQDIDGELSDDAIDNAVALTKLCRIFGFSDDIKRVVDTSGFASSLIVGECKYYYLLGKTEVKLNQALVRFLSQAVIKSALINYWNNQDIERHEAQYLQLMLDLSGVNSVGFVAQIKTILLRFFTLKVGSEALQAAFNTFADDTENASSREIFSPILGCARYMRYVYELEQALKRNELAPEHVVESQHILRELKVEKDNVIQQRLITLWQGSDLPRNGNGSVDTSPRVISRLLPIISDILLADTRFNSVCDAIDNSDLEHKNQLLHLLAIKKFEQLLKYYWTYKHVKQSGVDESSLVGTFVSSLVTVHRELYRETVCLEALMHIMSSGLFHSDDEMHSSLYDLMNDQNSRDDFRNALDDYQTIAGENQPKENNALGAAAVASSAVDANKSRKESKASEVVIPVDVSLTEPADSSKPPRRILGHARIKYFHTDEWKIKRPFLQKLILDTLNTAEKETLVNYYNDPGQPLRLIDELNDLDQAIVTSKTSTESKKTLQLILDEFFFSKGKFIFNTERIDLTAEIIFQVECEACYSEFIARLQNKEQKKLFSQEVVRNKFIELLSKRKEPVGLLALTPAMILEYIDILQSESHYVDFYTSLESHQQRDYSQMRCVFETSITRIESDGVKDFPLKPWIIRKAKNNVLSYADIKKNLLSYAETLNVCAIDFDREKLQKLICKLLSKTTNPIEFGGFLEILQKKSPEFKTLYAITFNKNNVLSLQRDFDAIFKVSTEQKSELITRFANAIVGICEMEFDPRKLVASAKSTLDAYLPHMRTSTEVVKIVFEKFLLELINNSRDFNYLLSFATNKLLIWDLQDSFSTILIKSRSGAPITEKEKLVFCERLAAKVIAGFKTDANLAVDFSSSIDRVSASPSGEMIQVGDDLINGFVAADSPLQESVSKGFIKLALRNIIKNISIVYVRHILAVNERREKFDGSYGEFIAQSGVPEDRLGIVLQWLLEERTNKYSRLAGSQEVIEARVNEDHLSELREVFKDLETQQKKSVLGEKHSLDQIFIYAKKNKNLETEGDQTAEKPAIGYRHKVIYLHELYQRILLAVYQNNQSKYTRLILDELQRKAHAQKEAYARSIHERVCATFVASAISRNLFADKLCDASDLRHALTQEEVNREHHINLPAMIAEARFNVLLERLAKYSALVKILLTKGIKEKLQACFRHSSLPNLDRFKIALQECKDVASVCRTIQDHFAGVNITLIRQDEVRSETQEKIEYPFLCADDAESAIGQVRYQHFISQQGFIQRPALKNIIEMFKNDLISAWVIRDMSRENLNFADLDKRLCDVSDDKIGELFDEFFLGNKEFGVFQHDGKKKDVQNNAKQLIAEARYYQLLVYFSHDKAFYAFLSDKNTRKNLKAFFVEQRCDMIDIRRRLVERLITRGVNSATDVLAIIMNELWRGAPSADESIDDNLAFNLIAEARFIAFIRRDDLVERPALRELFLLPEFRQALIARWTPRGFNDDASTPPATLKYLGPNRVGLDSYLALGGDISSALQRLQDIFLGSAHQFPKNNPEAQQILPRVLAESSYLVVKAHCQDNQEIKDNAELVKTYFIVNSLPQNRDDYKNIVGIARFVNFITEFPDFADILQDSSLSLVKSCLITYWQTNPVNINGRKLKELIIAVKDEKTLFLQAFFAEESPEYKKLFGNKALLSQDTLLEKIKLCARFYSLKQELQGMVYPQQTLLAVLRKPVIVGRLTAIWSASKVLPPTLEQHQQFCSSTNMSKEPLDLTVKRKFAEIFLALYLGLKTSTGDDINFELTDEQVLNLFGEARYSALIYSAEVKEHARVFAEVKSYPGLDKSTSELNATPLYEELFKPEIQAALINYFKSNVAPDTLVAFLESARRDPHLSQLGSLIRALEIAVYVQAVRAKQLLDAVNYEKISNTKADLVKSGIQQDAVGKFNAITDLQSKRRESNGAFESYANAIQQQNATDSKFVSDKKASDASQMLQSYIGFFNLLFTYSEMVRRDVNEKRVADGAQEFDDCGAFEVFLNAVKDENKPQPKSPDKPKPQLPVVSAATNSELPIAKLTVVKALTIKDLTDLFGSIFSGSTSADKSNTQTLLRFLKIFDMFHGWFEAKSSVPAARSFAVSFLRNYLPSSCVKTFYAYAKYKGYIQVQSEIRFMYLAKLEQALKGVIASTDYSQLADLLDEAISNEGTITQFINPILKKLKELLQEKASIDMVRGIRLLESITSCKHWKTVEEDPIRNGSQLAVSYVSAANVLRREVNALVGVVLHHCVESRQISLYVKIFNLMYVHNTAIEKKLLGKEIVENLMQSFACGHVADICELLSVYPNLEPRDQQYFKDFITNFYQLLNTKLVSDKDAKGSSDKSSKVYLRSILCCWIHHLFPNEAMGILYNKSNSESASNLKFYQSLNLALSNLTDLPSVQEASLHIAMIRGVSPKAHAEFLEKLNKKLYDELSKKGALEALELFRNWWPVVKSRVCTFILDRNTHSNFKWIGIFISLLQLYENTSKNGLFSSLSAEDVDRLRSSALTVVILNSATESVADREAKNNGERVVAQAKLFWQKIAPKDDWDKIIAEIKTRNAFEDLRKAFSKVLKADSSSPDSSLAPTPTVAQQQQASSAAGKAEKQLATPAGKPEENPLPTNGSHKGRRQTITADDSLELEAHLPGAAPPTPTKASSSTDVLSSLAPSPLHASSPLVKKIKDLMLQEVKATAHVDHSLWNSLALTLAYNAHTYHHDQNAKIKASVRPILNKVYQTWLTVNRNSTADLEQFCRFLSESLKNQAGINEIENTLRQSLKALALNGCKNDSIIIGRIKNILILSLQKKTNNVIQQIDNNPQEYADLKVFKGDMARILEQRHFKLAEQGRMNEVADHLATDWFKKHGEKYKNNLQNILEGRLAIKGLARELGIRIVADDGSFSDNGNDINTNILVTWDLGGFSHEKSGKFIYQIKFNDCRVNESEVNVNVPAAVAPSLS